MAISTINQNGLNAPLTLTSPVISTGGGNATFPLATGTVMVSGNMPAFSAYLNTTQNVTTNTTTLVQINAKEYDTANCFDTSTYKFTPNVAGYYQFNAAINSNTTVTRVNLKFYKNGTIAKYPTDIAIPSGASINSVEANALIYMNGTTDYVQLYMIFVGTSPQIYGGSGGNDPAYTYFQGYLARTA